MSLQLLIQAIPKPVESELFLKIRFSSSATEILKKSIFLFHPSLNNQRGRWVRDFDQTGFFLNEVRSHQEVQVPSLLTSWKSFLEKITLTKNLRPTVHSFTLPVIPYRWPTAFGRRYTLLNTIAFFAEFDWQLNLLLHDVKKFRGEGRRSEDICGHYEVVRSRPGWILNAN